MAQLVRVLSWYAPGCRFETQSGCIQKSTNECMSKWNNKSMFFSLSLRAVVKNFLKCIQDIIHDEILRWILTLTLNILITIKCRPFPRSWPLWGPLRGCLCIWLKGHRLWVSPLHTWPGHHARQLRCRTHLPSHISPCSSLSLKRPYLPQVQTLEPSPASATVPVSCSVSPFLWTFLLVFQWAPDPPLSHVITPCRSVFQKPDPHSGTLLFKKSSLSAQ